MVEAFLDTQQIKELNCQPGCIYRESAGLRISSSNALVTCLCFKKHIMFLLSLVLFNFWAVLTILALTLEHSVRLFSEVI